VSTWLGRGYTARFPKAYVAAVEEPFDSNDNTARSLGIRVGGGAEVVGPRSGVRCVVR
jgi:hypothetical protein